MTWDLAAGGQAGAEAGRLRRDIAARGYGHCVVGGHSMLPLLRAGEIVRIERRDRVRRGDIVAVTIAGTPSIHRVVAITPDGIVCCGDHCRHHDPVVPAADLYGVATLVAPGRRLRGGLLALALARARFWLLLIPWATRSAFDDAVLVWRQATGASLPPTRCMPGGSQKSEDGSMALLDVEAVERFLELSRAAAGEDTSSAGATQAHGLPDAQGVEIPAGVYSGLDAVDRRWLLEALTGRRVVVWGVLAQGPRLRLTSAVRRFLGNVGIRAGEPGDAAFPDKSSGWRPFHLFTAEDMRAELAAAGGRDIEVSVVTALGGVGYVRAAARF